MKKIITLIAITISMTASAQKKDTTKPDIDTVYVLSKPEMTFIQQVFRQNTISFNGKVLNFDDVLQIIQSFESKMVRIPKNQPKEQPKK